MAHETSCILEGSVSLQRKQHHWQKDKKFSWIFSLTLWGRNINKTNYKVFSKCATWQYVSTATLSNCEKVASLRFFSFQLSGFLHFKKAAYIVSFIVFVSNMTPTLTSLSFLLFLCCIPHQKPHGKTDKISQERPFFNFSPLGGTHLRVIQSNTVSYAVKYHHNMIRGGIYLNKTRVVCSEKWELPTFHQNRRHLSQLFPTQINDIKSIKKTV